MREKKPNAVFKFMASDFIVQEITKDGISRVSIFKDGCKLQNIEKKDREFLEKVKKNEISRKQYLYADLEKFNIDFFRVLKILRRKLDKGRKAISFAGIKDKRAWTSQKISVFMPKLSLLENFKHPCIFLKNFSLGDKPIKLGELERNNFVVTLRNLEEKNLGGVIENIKNTKKFPNYFGEQRFGSLKKTNYKIGKALLKKQWKKAVSLILEESGGEENEEWKKARERLKKEGDCCKALEYFDKKLVTERTLLGYLCKNKDDYLGSLKTLPRKNILIFVHAVQSYVFNKTLEKTLK